MKARTMEVRCMTEARTKLSSASAALAWKRSRDLRAKPFDLNFEISQLSWLNANLFIQSIPQHILSQLLQRKFPKYIISFTFITNFENYDISFYK